MLTYFVKVFKVINSEQSPGQIAAAISFACIVGLTPLLSLHNLLVLLIVLWFRVNLTIFFVAWPLFSLFGLMLATPAQSLGGSILQAEALLPMWESFYNTLIGRWSNFYYTGLIGSLVIAIPLAIICYPISKLLIVQYRAKWMSKLEKYKVFQILKTSKFWQLYSDHAS